MGNKDNILNFDNWSECGNGWDGRYRYIIGAKCAYEIMVLYHATDTDILTAKGTLYLMGLWKHQDSSLITLERECLLPEGITDGLPIQELLQLARKDFEKVTY